MYSTTSRYCSLVLVLLLFIAAVFSPSVLAGSPCSGAMARQNERCRNNISFFKRMMDSQTRGTDKLLEDNFEATAAQKERQNDNRKKYELLVDLLTGLEQNNYN